MPLCFTYMARRLGRLLAAICLYVLRIWHAVWVVFSRQYASMFYVYRTPFGRLLAAICLYVLRIWHAVMLGSNLLNRESCFHWARVWGICALWCYEIVHQYLLSVSVWGIGLLNANTNTGTPATVLDIHICIPPSGPGSLFPHKGIYLKIKLFKCRCSISCWLTDNNPRSPIPLGNKKLLRGNTISSHSLPQEEEANYQISYYVHIYFRLCLWLR